ncbi:hypothetical protein DVH05_017160 [Phytophthora capsici]|nr:hypothetical protein DVH05_017160 [Phytophthora capsici]
MGVVERGNASIPDEELKHLFSCITGRIVLLPVNCNGSHWCGIMVDTAKTTIKYYDSMSSSFTGTMRVLAHKLVQYMPATPGRYRVIPMLRMMEFN